MLARQQEGAIGGWKLPRHSPECGRTHRGGRVKRRWGGRALHSLQAVVRKALATAREDAKSKPITKSKIFTNLTRGQQWHDARLAGVFKTLESASFDPGDA